MRRYNPVGPVTCRSGGMVGASRNTRRRSVLAEPRFVALFALVLALSLLEIALAVSTYRSYRQSWLTIERLTNASDSVRYLDEVLTMSARMGALTGDQAWERRYRSAIPKLDAALAEIERLDPTAAGPVREISQANGRLVTAEREAFILASAGKTAQASAILLGGAYERDKAIYTAGLEALVRRIAAHTDSAEAGARRGLVVSMLIAGAIIVAMGGALLIALFGISGRLETEQALGEVSRDLATLGMEQLDEQLVAALGALGLLAGAEITFLVIANSDSDESQSWVWSQPGSDFAQDNSRLTAHALAGIMRNQNVSDLGVVWMNGAGPILGFGGTGHEDLAELGTHSLIGAAFACDVDRVALFGLASSHSRPRWSRSEAPLLRTAADTLVKAVQRAEIKQQLMQLATTDQLTGLANVATFRSQLADEVDRIARTHERSALLMLDIDRFKEVNDTHGHAAGDVVLVSVSACMVDALRRIDSLGRLGGEEFAAILPGTDADAAVKAAERLRSDVEELDTVADTGDIRVTVSVGVTLILESDTTDSALRRADEALYAAKRAGRNRVRRDAGT